MRQNAIWINHVEAHVFHIDRDTLREDTIGGATHHVHRHPKSQETKTRNHPLDEAHFFDRVLAAVEDSDELLIMGPSVTKLRLLRHAQKHAPALADRVIGLETADQATDRQLAAHVRHYFHKDSPRIGVAS